MRLSHKQKVKMARRMRTREEMKNKTPIFLTEAWDRRKKAIKERVKKIMEAAGLRRLKNAQTNKHQ